MRWHGWAAGARRAAMAAALAVAGALPGLGAGLQEVPGAADPEGFKRFEGAVIIGTSQSGFDDFTYPTGKVLNFDGEVEGKASVEGPRSRLIYLVPEGRSKLEVMRNYQAELADKGFETIYQCAKDACGRPADMARLVYPPGNRLNNLGQVTERAFSLPRDDQQYLVARQPETGQLVSLYIALETFDHFPETHGKTEVLMDVVDAKPLERRMEQVSAAEMATALGEGGRIALYGIFFDHDSDRLKPESGATLDEIAALMTADPGLKLFVVGHTDMTGDYDYNLDLSRRRAASVVAALTGDKGVPATALSPAGVGPLSPVADSATDEGRAQNRRVELVKR